MSASLVGSEMCIRDSLNTCPRSSRWLQSALRFAQMPNQPTKRACGRTGGAVSYTHLTLPTICSV
eukprot:3064624-Alexandrium_andersonii.AAC.1